MSKIIQNCIILYLLLLFAGCGTLTSAHLTYKNLENRTSYVYNTERMVVLEAINKLDGEFLTESIYLYVLADGKIGIVMRPHYSNNYWNGVREEDVEYPEAGKIGQIQGEFEIKITESGGRTAVEVSVVKLVQEIGRENVIFPDFKTVGVYKKVPSDTYCEYLFLHKLGELLGEKNMPEVKSR